MMVRVGFNPTEIWYKKMFQMKIHQFNGFQEKQIGGREPLVRGKDAETERKDFERRKKGKQAHQLYLAVSQT